MLEAATRALRTPDLRGKILFALAMIGLFRLGSQVPTPNVNYSTIQDCVAQADSTVTGFINLFSGGALLQLSVFALGIMPYITASIILQLLVVVIPRLETLKKEGQAGQQKITQYTRYLTVGLAVLQSSTIVALAANRQLPTPGCDSLADDSVLRLLLMVVVMTAGTAMVMWLGELITDRGVGNGMSVLIFASIASRIPFEGAAILETRGALLFGVLLLLVALIIGAVVFVEQAQRRVPVQYAKRMVGRKMYGGTSTYIPLKVNQAGVIPVIFSSSLLYVPTLVGQAAGEDSAVGRFVGRYLVDPTDPLYLSVYFLLTVFFCFFYVAITFDPNDVADNMKKYGGFVPGIRPGRPTAEYLDFILTRLTSAGALYLGIVAILPFLFFNVVGNAQNFPFGGVAVLIVVGVGLETVKQIESQLLLRNYEGFLR